MIKQFDSQYQSNNQSNQYSENLEELADPIQIIAENLGKLQLQNAQNSQQKKYGQNVIHQKQPHEQYYSQNRQSNLPNSTVRKSQQLQQLNEEQEQQQQSKTEKKCQNENKQTQDQQEAFKKIQQSIRQNLKMAYNFLLSNLPQSFMSSSYQQKINQLLQIIQNEQNQQIMLGAYVFLFQLLYHFKNVLNKQTLQHIGSVISAGISSEIRSYCVLQLIAFLGWATQIQLHQISKILVDEQEPILQKKAFLALINLDYSGFYTLLDIANVQYTSIPDLILCQMTKVPQIIQVIIIPSLINDYNNGTNQIKYHSISILRGIPQICLQNSDILSFLMRVLEENHVDKYLVANVIRKLGVQGQNYLCKLIKTSKNSKMKLAAINAFGQRRSEYLKYKAKFKVGNNKYIEHKNIGSLINYQSSFMEGQSFQKRQIQIKFRDFMAALHRLLAVKYQLYEKKEHIQHDPFKAGFEDMFSLAKLIDTRIIQNQTSNQISLKVLKTLESCLNESSPQIRQITIRTIGIIGYPECMEFTDHIYKALSDKQNKVRAMSCWIIQKLNVQGSPKFIKKLLDLLKDSYWKVRISACITLGSIVKNPNEQIFSNLLKVLKDGSVNRTVVCDTIIKMGQSGQSILIQLLRVVCPTDFKLKCAIVEGFKSADVAKPSIDFVIEQLFKISKYIISYRDQNQNLRALCLQTLMFLRMKGKEENITYLKPKNILPLFYSFLNDPSYKLRQIAVDAILSYGAQAELIFIQGLTKQKSPLIRAQCAKGLSRLGVQNFRALLFGMRDQDERVRKSTFASVSKHISGKEVVNYFRNKENILPSLICNVKDIYRSGRMPMKIQEMLSCILQQLDQQKEQKRICKYKEKQNRSINNQ